MRDSELKPLVIQQMFHIEQPTHVVVFTGSTCRASSDVLLRDTNSREDFLSLQDTCLLRAAKHDITVLEENLMELHSEYILLCPCLRNLCISLMFLLKFAYCSVTTVVVLHSLWLGWLEDGRAGQPAVIQILNPEWNCKNPATIERNASQCFTQRFMLPRGWIQLCR